MSTSAPVQASAFAAAGIISRAGSRSAARANSGVWSPAAHVADVGRPRKHPAHRLAQVDPGVGDVLAETVREDVVVLEVGVAPPQTGHLDRGAGRSRNTLGQPPMSSTGHVERGGGGRAQSEQAHGAGRYDVRCAPPVGHDPLDVGAGRQAPADHRHRVEQLDEGGQGVDPAGGVARRVRRPTTESDADLRLRGQRSPRRVMNARVEHQGRVHPVEHPASAIETYPPPTESRASPLTTSPWTGHPPPTSRPRATAPPRSSRLRQRLNDGSVSRAGHHLRSRCGPTVPRNGFLRWPLKRPIAGRGRR